MRSFNTLSGSQALKLASSSPSTRNAWSPSERRVADLLLSDFEKSGIHMPPAARSKFVELHDEILRVGHEFALNARPGVEAVEVRDPWNRMKGVRSDLIRTLTRSDVARVPTSGTPAQTIMRTARDPAIRKQLYIGTNSATPEQVAGLEKLLRLRAELGKLLGKESYAEVYLEDKMARSPDGVMKFLRALSGAHMPKAQAEIDTLRSLKKLHGSETGELEAWDRQFYAGFLPSPPSEVSSAMHMPLAHPGVEKEKLKTTSTSSVSLGTAISGLSRLLHILYGIRLVPSPVAPGETWHPDVRRLDAVHDTEGKVGTIYYDLWARGERKYENAAHFTVQCSRRVDWDAEDPLGGTGEAGVEVIGMEGRYKLPVVVLVTNFSRGGRVSWNEVETVFHEMGHAVHSMLARTDFQHVAGTRCQMDFVEVPSTLMEFLLRRVGIPGVAIPPPQRDALDFQTQVRLAILDQEYHSSRVLERDFDSGKIAADVQNAYDAMPYVPGTAWQVQFGHLFSYGCGYYTYLWSRLWAGRIYRQLFAGKSEKEMRESGERLRREVLVWGGGRDGWESLKGLGMLRGKEDVEGLEHVDLEELEL